MATLPYIFIPQPSQLIHKLSYHLILHNLCGWKSVIK